jgi:hypothetical protein
VGYGLPKGMGYAEIWESLVHLAGNRLGGHEKVWVIEGYGLSQVWVKTETTVFTLVILTLEFNAKYYLITCCKSDSQPVAGMVK